MIRKLLLVSLLLFFAACSQSTGDQVIGKWKFMQNEIEFMDDNIMIYKSIIGVSVNRIRGVGSGSGTWKDIGDGRIRLSRHGGDVMGFATLNESGDSISVAFNGKEDWPLTMLRMK